MTVFIHPVLLTTTVKGKRKTITMEEPDGSPLFLYDIERGIVPVLKEAGKETLSVEYSSGNKKGKIIVSSSSISIEESK